MPHILMAVGAVLALAGVGSIAAGAPDWVAGLSLGATLIQSGTIALVGGIILIALGLVLHALQDLLHRLEGFSAGIPVRPAVPALTREERMAAPGQPRPPHGGEAPPRPREATVMQPAEDPARTRRERAPEPAGEETRPRPVTYTGDEPARPRREAPPAPAGERSRPRTLEQASEELARIRSELPLAGRNGAQRSRRDGLPPLPQPLPSDDRRRAKPSEETGGDYAPRFRPVDPAPPSAPSRGGAPADTVVRSGVIGGMAYTLYADGSIEAELSMGTVRFNSISELQEHVNRTGTEADGDFSDSQR
jgi:hypothetical protein